MAEMQNTFQQNLDSMLYASQLDEAWEYAQNQVFSQPNRNPRDVRMIQGVELLHRVIKLRNLTLLQFQAKIQNDTTEFRRWIINNLLWLGQRDVRLFPIPDKLIYEWLKVWQVEPKKAEKSVRLLVRRIAQAYLDPTIQLPALSDAKKKAWCSLRDSGDSILLGLLYQDESLLLWVVCHFLMLEENVAQPRVLYLSWFLTACNRMIPIVWKQKLVQQWLNYLVADQGKQATQNLTIIAFTQHYLARPRRQGIELFREALRRASPQDMFWCFATPLHQIAMMLHEGVALSEIRSELDTYFKTPGLKTLPAAWHRALFFQHALKIYCELGTSNFEQPEYSLTEHLTMLEGDSASSSRVYLLPSVGFVAWSVQDYSRAIECLLPIYGDKSRIEFTY